MKDFQESGRGETSVLSHQILLCKAKTTIPSIQTMSSNVASNIVWVDLEMTGLEIEKGDVIIEIACLVTDANLNILGEV